jgi:molybdopterin-guanine dinucleotide biosynthesis protein A
LDETTVLKKANVHTPLIGFYTLFKELLKLNDFSKTFIISCDMPLIKPEVIDLLIERSEKFDCVIPKWENGWVEPLFSIYPIKKGLEASKSMLENQEYKLLRLFRDDWNINYLSINEEIQKVDKNLQTFININRQKDLEKMKPYLFNKY